MSVKDKVKNAKKSIHTQLPHVVVLARAGTGKTTTLVEGLKVVKGLAPSIEPSPQQEAIWKQIAKSEGATTVCFCCFNKSIQKELKSRVPQGCDAMTMHSMGLRAVTKRFGRVDIEENRVMELIALEMGRDIRELRKNKFDLLRLIQQMVGLCKVNLLEGTAEDIDYLTSFYDVEMNGHRKQVIDIVPKILARCKDVDADGRIDFNDMIWLPVVLNLPVFRYQLLLVDEAQDLNKCQQELALKAGWRIVFVGDDKQAIYGFAGADSDAIPNLIKHLESTRQGCEVLPLTMTRRCGKAIVAEAQQYVPDFEAWEDNPDGEIKHMPYNMDDGDPEVAPPDGASYHRFVDYGDMLLCRVNAPLVQQCFHFIKSGRKANIQGRDVAKGLISLIDRMKAEDVAELQAKLSDWLEKETARENAKRLPSENKIIALHDKYDCLACFMEGKSDIKDVKKSIDELFTDDKDNPGIKLSSVHKAKGLEANRVFLLQPEGASIPHPMAKGKWQRDQEFNLLYVAITRAIEELVYVQ